MAFVASSGRRKGGRQRVVAGDGERQFSDYGLKRLGGNMRERTVVFFNFFCQQETLRYLYQVWTIKMFLRLTTSEQKR